jgi:hypothetical protein
MRTAWDLSRPMRVDLSMKGAIWLRRHRGVLREQANFTWGDDGAVTIGVNHVGKTRSRHDGSRGRDDRNSPCRDCAEPGDADRGT